MLEWLRVFLRSERFKYIFVTVVFMYSVFVTFRSNFLLCLFIVAIYVAYDEERNVGLQPAEQKEGLC